MNPSDWLVLIVAHGAILREGYRQVVESIPGLHVIASVTEPGAAINALRGLHPDVVLIDNRLPNGMAFFLTRAVQRESPSARVVMLSSEADEAFVEQAAEAGAAAVVLERIGSDELGAVLRTVGGDGIDFLEIAVSEGCPPDGAIDKSRSARSDAGLARVTRGLSR